MNRIILPILALCCGGVITYIDSQPNWDDTGITAMAILLTTAVFAFLSPKQWWLWAMAIGLGIPIVGIVQSQNFGSLMALVVACIGAILGMLIRHGIANKPTSADASSQPT